MKHKYSILLFVAFVVIFYRIHENSSIMYTLLFLIMFIQSIQDIKTLEVSNLSMCLLFLLCLCIVVIQENSLSWIFMGAFGVSSILFLLYKMTGAEGIGGADVKFMFCCGTILGFYGTFQALFYACISALLFHIVTKFYYTKLPFIPFLAFGVYISLIVK